MNNDDKKRCNRCHVILPFANFSTKRNGDLQKVCIRCNEVGRKYIEKNKEKIKKWKQEHYENNKEKTKEKKKKYRIEHKEHISEHDKLYRDTHKEQIKERGKKYYETNKEIISQKTKIYIKSTIDIIIKGKIQAYMKRDIKYNRSFNETDYVDSDWIKERLIKFSNNCELCGKGLKLTGYEFRDPEQFSVDRKDNKIAHLKTNCQITCWKCNQAKH